MHANAPALKTLGTLLLAAWLGRAAAAPAAIDRIDPPSWWVGFAEPTVQLLVHGPDVAALTPSLEYPGVRLTDVTRTANPNYLFLTLQVSPATLPGALPLEFRRDGVTVLHRDYPLQARRPGSRDRRGVDAADVVYLALPDRFANGDPANDQVPGLADRVDRRDPEARHGGDLAGVAQRVAFLADLGFTQLALTPVLENAQPAASYRGDAITDHYRVDPRYGSNDDLRVLAQVAREHGMGLLGEFVVDHVGSGHWWLQDLPDPQWLAGDGRYVPAAPLRPAVQDPHGAAVDRQRLLAGWPDAARPVLQPLFAPLGTYLVQNALWWIEYADLAGLRLDAVDAVDRRFLAAFAERVTREYPHLALFGAAAAPDPARVAYWQAGHANADGYVAALPGAADGPLREALLAGLLEPEQPAQARGLARIYQCLADDFVYAQPDRLLVFADTPDTDRLYTALGRDDALWRMAIALLATTRGTPQLLYGTEVLLAQDKPGRDGERRRDFPGGWPGDRADGFTGTGLAPDAVAAQRFLRTLLTWRRHEPAIQQGTLLQYVPVDGVYVYFRRHGADGVMVALNKNARPTELALERFGEGLAGARTGVDIVTRDRLDLTRSVTLAPRSATVIELQ